ncbi:MAG TPA: PxKF domain-containing protein, partial [Pyrinomonadaceae bacterium]|nr:PxKF domain-containing protein [Pyrinomonadaceae bacterium]
GCSSAQSSFTLGDEVCVTVTNAPTFFGFPARRVEFLNPAGHVVQSTSITDDPQDVTFTLPADATQTIGGVTVDNRGVWAVNLYDPFGMAVRARALFKVAQAGHTASDLALQDFVRRESVYVDATDDFNASFFVSVFNGGPDDAQNVELTTAVPADTTFVSATQTVGPAADCTHPAAESTGTSTCTVASLPEGARASFVFVYKVNAGVAAKTLINHTASASSATGDPRPLNNTASASALVIGSPDPATCDLTCPANVAATANTIQNGQPGAFVKFGAASAVGECGAVSNSPASGSFFTVGTHTVTSSASGGGSCTFTVKVLDTPAPTISCPPHKTATADEDGTANVAVGTPTFTASGGGTVLGVRSDSIRAVLDDDGNVITPASDKALTDPYPVGITGILWTVTDADGRTASCRQVIFVKAGTCGTDTEDPVITSAPADITVGTGPGNTSPTVALDDELGQLGATDNCSVTISLSGVPAGNAFPIGTTNVTHTATDGAGNSVSHVQKVTVVDNTPPFIAAPADAAYVCPSQVPAAHPSQATRGDVFDEDGNLLPPGPPFDNSGTVTVTVSETSAGAGSAASPLVITRTFTATDPYNNSASAVQTITVNDSTPPTITAPADAAYQCPFEVPAAHASQATAADNCSVSVGVTETTNGGAGSPASPLVITRTFTATDGAGNTASDVQTITVIDTTPPSLTPPADIVVYLPLNTTAVSMPVSYPNPATASDNCNGSVNVVYGPASGSTFNVGTTAVTVTATDPAGNQTVKQFNVTVLYNFAGFFSPVANLPVLNTVNAGRAVPVKFKLSGNKGLNIFAAGSPASGPVACNSNDPAAEVTETVTAGGSSLQYDPNSDQYNYVWKTESSWAGTCRQLVLQLNDGSFHRANFKFK